MKDSRALSILNAMAFVIHVSIAYLTQLKLVNSTNVGEISDRYNSLFTPAPITFSIWGVIYTMLAIFCLYHIVTAFKRTITHPANNDLRRIGGYFILNNLATAAWLLTWTRDMMLISFLLIIVQLLSLAAIYRRLGIFNRMRNSGFILCTQFPLSIYFGWISLATIANTSVYLVSTGWDGGGISPVYWTMIMIGVATILGVWMIFTRRDILFGLVIIWALYGILLKDESRNAAAYESISKAAMAGMALLALACIVQALQQMATKRRLPAFPEAKSSLK